MKQLIIDAFDRVNGMCTRMEISLNSQCARVRRVNMQDPDAQEKITWDLIEFSSYNVISQLLEPLEDLDQIDMAWEQCLIESVFYHILACLGDELNYENIDIIMI